MLSSLLKTAKATSSVLFVLTFFFGALSVTTLMFRMPAPLEWMLSLFCPFAFGAEMAKVEHYVLFYHASPHHNKADCKHT